MKLRNRFLLVGFGVAVFLIATPILVLFTRGYQVDWANHRFVKTGSLVVKTLPSKSSVYLNEEKASGVTPETIRFLKPGDYNVRIDKEGFQSWTKRLAINAQFATFANQDRDFITLFKQNPEQTKSEQINFSELSQTGAEIAYVSGGKLYSYNTDNSDITSIGAINNFSIPYNFSNNLLWENASKTYSFFSDHAQSTELDVSQIKKAVTNGDYMALIYKDQLYLLGNAGPQLLDKQVTDIWLEGEDLWYTTKTSLIRYNLRLRAANTIYPTLPLYTSSRIVHGDNNTFLLLDSSLYTLNDTLEKIYDGVNFANYDASAHRLLFANANQILVYDPSKKSTDLILSSIGPISNPVLNSYTGYVFFENENKIKAIELDGRDHRNIYTITDLTDPLSRFIVSNEGTLLTVFSNANLTTLRIR